MKEHLLFGSWKLFGFMLGLIWGISNLIALFGSTSMKLSRITASTETLVAMLPFYLTSRVLKSFQIPQGFLIIATMILTLLIAIVLAIVILAVLELVYNSIAVEK